jgi:hypothetical protein
MTTRGSVTHPRLEGGELGRRSVARADVAFLGLLRGRRFAAGDRHVLVGFGHTAELTQRASQIQARVGARGLVDDRLEHRQRGLVVTRVKLLQRGTETSAGVGLGLSRGVAARWFVGKDGTGCAAKQQAHGEQ